MIALGVLSVVVVALVALGVVAAKRENARRGDGGEVVLFGDAGADGGASSCHDGGFGGGCDVGGGHH